jgi:hypothetical protein
MKYLSDYMRDAQTELLNKLGAFFAFGDEQFKEKRVEGVEYQQMASGLIVPKENALAVWEGFETILNNAIAQDIAENGKEAIIRRELFNHECFYDGEIARAIDALEMYKFPKEEIIAMYNHILKTEDTD